MYQQMVGLHQPLTGDQSRMVVDRTVLQEATTVWKQKTVNANVIQEHQRMSIVFAHFDTAGHSDREILALTETELGLTYDDPPMWKPVEGPLDLSKQQILASTAQCGSNELYHIHDAGLRRR